MPCVTGYIVEGGVTRQPYGGHRISEALNTCLVQCNYAFFSDVEFYIVRLAMEKVRIRGGCGVKTEYNNISMYILYIVY